MNKCYECGGEIKLIFNSEFKWKNTTFPISAIGILTCVICGEEWIDSDTADQLDEAYEVYKQNQPTKMKG